jgi:hypothetical protein
MSIWRWGPLRDPSISISLCPRTTVSSQSLYLPFCKVKRGALTPAIAWSVAATHLVQSWDHSKGLPTPHLKAQSWTLSWSVQWAAVDLPEERGGCAGNGCLSWGLGHECQHKLERGGIERQLPFLTWEEKDEDFRPGSRDTSPPWGSSPVTHIPSMSYWTNCRTRRSSSLDLLAVWCWRSHLTSDYLTQTHHLQNGDNGNLPEWLWGFYRKMLCIKYIPQGPALRKHSTNGVVIIHGDNPCSQ